MRINTISNTIPMTVRNNKQNKSGLTNQTNSQNPNFGMKVDITKNLRDYLLSKTNAPDELCENLQKLGELSDVYRGLKVVFSRGILNPLKPIKVTCMIDEKDEIVQANNINKLLAHSHTDRYFINEETIPCNYRFEDVGIDPAWPAYWFNEYPYDYILCAKSCADKLLEKSHKLYNFESDLDIDEKMHLFILINPDLKNSPAKEKFNDAVKNSLMKYRKQEIQEKLKGI